MKGWGGLEFLALAVTRQSVAFAGAKEVGDIDSSGDIADRVDVALEVNP